VVVVVVAVVAVAAHNQGVGPQSGEWATFPHAREGEGQRATVKNAHLDSDRRLFSSRTRASSQCASSRAKTLLDYGAARLAHIAVRCGGQS
jgi:hypothetical protein